MKFLVPVYAATIFLSAFLLFSVQPMVGKYLLPLLGGGPSVWNTAMLFFQILLLGGYSYAHAMARFIKPQSQFIIHLALLVLASLSLPLALTSGADPTGQNPMAWQLTTMFSMAAGPFFILSASAPLLQQWFARAHHDKAENPYFLYAASNAGSMLALLSYPFLIEPLLNLSGQSHLWSAGYALLGALILLSRVLSKFEKDTPAPPVQVDTEASPITWTQRGAWLLLSFVPSSLMLGLTSYITSDVTTVPLFWIIPLALYLLTFIIAFSEKPFFTLPLTRIVQGATVLLLLFHMMFSGLLLRWEYTVIHGLFFFFTALMCHQELVAQKPKPKHLTEFFLIMSLGGALGGVFNTLLAPLLFSLPYEYMATAIISTFCRFSATQPLFHQGRFAAAGYVKAYGKFLAAIVLIAIILFANNPFVTGILGSVTIMLSIFYFGNRFIFAALCTLLFLAFPMIRWDDTRQNLVTVRNYYGVVRVRDSGDARLMLHGTTNHGGQSLDPQNPFKPMSYYNLQSGLADVFRLPYITQGTAPRHIAIIGLGSGCIACFYNREDRFFDYYEIDPAVIKISQDPQYFTYLSKCVSHYTIHEGDGRLQIAHAPDHSYDAIVLDAFSSDNIPMHIITKEAVEIYLSKLKPGGLLVFHVSNRFFSLEEELAVVAKDLNIASVRKDNKGKDPSEMPNKNTRVFDAPTKYVVLTTNKDAITALLKASPEWQTMTANDGWRAWTDDYANIIRSMRF